MHQTLGETREIAALEAWKLVNDFAEKMKYEKRPFYIVYAAKPDPALKGAVIDGKVACGGIRQTVKAYYARPPAIIGILVWYVDNNLGVFDFVPELSAPPDVPLDPSLLSDKSEEQFSGVMEKGKKLKVLVS